MLPPRFICRARPRRLLITIAPPALAAATGLPSPDPPSTTTTTLSRPSCDRSPSNPGRFSSSSNAGITTPIPADREWTGLPENVTSYRGMSFSVQSYSKNSTFVPGSSSASR